MIAWFPNARLGVKLVASLILFTIIPLLFVALFVNLHTLGIIRDAEIAQMLQVMKSTRFTLGTVIDEVESLSLQQIADSSVQDMLRRFAEGNTMELERVRSRLVVPLEEILKARPYISSICFSAGGQIILQAGEKVSAEDGRFNAEAARIQGRVYWTPVYELASLLQPHDAAWTVSLMRLVKDLDTQEPLAIERISIRESSLSLLFTDLLKMKGSSFVITDSNDTVVSASDKSLLGVQIYDSFPNAPHLSGDEGVVPFVVNGVASVLLHYRLPQVPWRIVYVVPLSRLETQGRLVNLVLVLSALFCAFFGLLFLLILNRTVVRPLGSLSQQMDKIKRGTYAVEWDYRKRDEIGRLGEDFVAMARHLDNLITTVYESRIQENQARLIALESQINPHFLFNTLDSIRWLAVGNGDLGVSEQLEALSDLFHQVLRKGDAAVTVAEEVEYLESYLFIQEKRFGEKLSVELSLEEEAGREKTPGSSFSRWWRMPSSTGWRRSSAKEACGSRSTAARARSI